MVSLQYDREQNLVTFTVQGVLSLNEIVDAANKWSADPHFEDDINMLWDMRDASWQTAVSEFLLLADEISNRVNEIWNGDKVALLVETRTEVALVDTHLASLGWNAQWRGFTAHAEAMAWLLSQVATY